MFLSPLPLQDGLEAGFRSYAERQSVRDLPQKASPLLPEDVYEDLVPVLRKEVLEQWKRREDPFASLSAFFSRPFMAFEGCAWAFEAFSVPFGGFFSDDRCRSFSEAISHAF